MPTLLRNRVRRMNTQFGGRQSEDEPTVPRIDRGKPEHVAKESAHRLRILGVNHHMGGVDHSVTSNQNWNRATNCPFRWLFTEFALI